jgi:alanine-synthesizing transaminase
MKAAARARGEDVVDLGMGNPDGAPPAHVIAKLAEVANKPHVHRYSASRGIPGLRKAQAAYYHRRFGVTLDPDREVIVTLGSKEGLANLAQAITAPGDVVAQHPSVLLRREIYVSAALAGATTFVALARLELAVLTASLAGFAVAFGVRAGAIRFGWTLPGFRSRPG